jgi:death-on-curing protein
MWLSAGALRSAMSGFCKRRSARPQATAFGEDAYSGLDEKAAALLQSVVAGHALVDGNKRLGWVAIRLFYLLNDVDIRPAADDAFELVVEIAAGDAREVREIAQRLGRWRADGE